MNFSKSYQLEIRDDDNTYETAYLIPDKNVDACVLEHRKE